MYLSGQKKRIRDLAAALGVVLWVGILGPEIFVSPGTGCIVDENGEALSAEDARDLMERYFYGSCDADGEEEAEVDITYKIALLELLRD